MLYDPKWEQKTKADPFTLESLIAWLEKMPADGKYDYCRSDHCLIAQWLKHLGHERVSVGPAGYFSTGSILSGQMPISIVEVARSLGAWTFGTALKRARAALTSTVLHQGNER